MIAFDCSNYTGPLTVGTMDKLKAWNVTNGMFGTQDPVICNGQLQSWADYGNADLYIQFDANKRAYPQISQGYTIKDSNRIGDVYVAVEQVAIPWNGTVMDYLSLLDEALAIADGLGTYPAGIYTSASQWAKLTNNSMSPKYAKRKLWYANYDHAQLLTPAIWRAQGFGPWWTPTWKQYEAGADNMGYLLPSGQKVDFSVGV